MNHALLLLLLTLPLAGWLTGCGGTAADLNERNSYYQQGAKLLEKGRHADAAAAFENCLRFAPASWKAHVQLGLLYEDHLRDYPRAIIHYQAYLEQAPPEQREFPADQWLERAQRKYYDHLGKQLAATTAELLSGSQAATSAAPAPRDNMTSTPAAKPGTSTRPPLVATTGGQRPTAMPAPESSPAQPAVATAAETPPAPATPVAVYTVMPGDNLSGIAKRYYGSAQKWQLILDANRDQLSTPEKLMPGMSIRLPPAPGK